MKDVPSRHTMFVGNWLNSSEKPRDAVQMKKQNANEKDVEEEVFLYNKETLFGKGMKPHCTSHNF